MDFFKFYGGNVNSFKEGIFSNIGTSHENFIEIWATGKINGYFQITSWMRYGSSLPLEETSANLWETKREYNLTSTICVITFMI